MSVTGVYLILFTIKNKHLSSGVAIEHNSTMGKSVNDIHLCKNLSLGLLISLNLSLVNFLEIASLNSTLLKFLIAPDCDESLTCRGLNLISGHFSCFTFIFVSCAESCLLVSWCAGGRCGMGGSDEDHGRSSRPRAEDQAWSHRSDTWWPNDQEVG
jgi:hypothetical protein